MRRILLVAAGLLWALPVMAQQPSVDDMSVAYQVAAQQRNDAQDKFVELSVTAKRLQGSYEARLATAMAWLKEAQAKAQP